MTTVASIISRSDQLIRDTSNYSVTAADRLRAVSMAIQSLFVDFGFDQTNKTYQFNYYDTLNAYNITTAVPSYLDSVDLRLSKDGEHIVQFSRKTPRELATEINVIEDDSFAVEKYNNKNYLLISHVAKYQSVVLHDCESLTANGTWTADTSTSDATNLTLDEVEFEIGSASLNFDVDVSQSVNNRATIYNSSLDSVDLSDYENLAALLFRARIPESTSFSSITAYWGSSDSAYWSATVTSDAFSESITENQWQRYKVNWSDATMTGTPDSSAIDYLRFDFNYAGGYIDQTDFRLDDIRMARPEALKLFYNSWVIGTDTTGTTDLYEFTATTDIPFYSGQFDFFDNYVAMKTAAILFAEMGLQNDALFYETKSEVEKNRLKKKFPTTRLTPTKSFKVKGISWNK